MLGLPKATEYGRRIPKNKFYEQLTVTPELKRLFVEQIASITWSHKLSPETLHVGAGARVREIEVIWIQLGQRDIDRRVLTLIDSGIPYHILFVLEHQGSCQLNMSYKPDSTAKPLRCFLSEWQPLKGIQITLHGLNMDAIYDNLVRWIAGDALPGAPDADLGQAVERAAEREKIEKQIAALTRRRNSEKQLNRQLEYNQQIKALKRLLEE